MPLHFALGTYLRVQTPAWSTLDVMFNSAVLLTFSPVRRGVGAWGAPPVKGRGAGLLCSSFPSALGLTGGYLASLD